MHTHIQQTNAAANDIALINESVLADKFGYSSSEWERALAHYRYATRAMNQFHAIHVAPANRRHDLEKTRESIEEVFKQEDRWAPYTSAQHGAGTKLMLASAPDLDAVALKIEVGHQLGIFTNDDPEIIEALVSDLRRLGAASPISVEKPC